jgi:hypothetical protein
LFLLQKFHLHLVLVNGTDLPGSAKPQVIAASDMDINKLKYGVGTKRIWAKRELGGFDPRSPEFQGSDGQTKCRKEDCETLFNKLKNSKANQSAFVVLWQFRSIHKPSN